jgi:hypothetical protein
MGHIPTAQGEAQKRRRLGEAVNTEGKYYLVTIRMNKLNFLSKEDLDIKHRHIINSLSKYGTEWSDQIGYELDKRNVLHLHTYMYCTKAPWYKSNDGWNIQFKAFNVADITNIIGYINKCGSSPYAIQQRETESYIYTTGGIFID